MFGNSRIMQACFIFLFFPSLLAVAQYAPSSNATTYQPPVFKDDNRDEKIKSLLPVAEEMFKNFAIEKKLPGLTFGIVVNGRLLYSGGTGYSHISAKIPAEASSLFRIASMTKSVTAMAILKLRDEGKLKLDDDVSRYIPVLKDIPLLALDAAPVTIRDLLTHTAGFPEDNPWGDRQLDISDDAFMDMLKKGISFSNVPGNAMEYSNMGYAMLGEIIRRVSGISYQNYITQNILLPLGMTHTVWEYSIAPPAMLAHGYRWLNDNWQEEELLHDGVYGAMGGLITSIGDFSKYMMFHLSAWPARNEKETGPLKRSSVREMQQMWRISSLSETTTPFSRSVVANGYGYGLSVSLEGEGKMYVSHSGGLPGFGSNWMILPDYGIGVVSFGNITYAGMRSVNKRVLDTLVYGAGLKPRELPVSPILKKRKDELVKLLPAWYGAEGSKIFAVNFFADHALSVRKQQSLELFKKMGRLIRIEELIPENQLRGKFILRGEKADIEIYFTLTPENPALIQQMSMKEVKKNK